MPKPLRICMIGTWPAADVLPLECVRPRYRGHKAAHPTSWLRCLVDALVAHDEVFSVDVLVYTREVLRAQEWRSGALRVVFVPKIEPIRADPLLKQIPARLRLRPWLRSIAPDIVHGHGTESGNGWLAVTSGYPHVVSLQGIISALKETLGWSRLRLQATQRCEIRTVQRADGIIVKSCWAEAWTRLYREEKNVRLIPNVVNEMFTKIETDYSEPVCICIGTLSVFKNPQMVLRAFANVRLQGARCVMIGEGELRAECVTLARSLGIAERTTFTGRLSRSSMVQIMRQARCLAIGSRVDTSPNVITEALAMGIPVVGTNACGVPEQFIDHVEGFVVEVDNIQAMADKLTYLLSDPEAAARMGKAGRARVLHEHSPERIAQQHLDWYREILRQEPNGTHKGEV